MASELELADLRADCGNCFGLCCVALHFTRSAEFAIDKPAGRPCPNLAEDFGCGIHDRLRERGFSGCTVFDCLGAGQKVSQVTFGGTDWRQDPQIARQMFATLPVMRQLHELLWYATEAMSICDGLATPEAKATRTELGEARDETERLTRGSAEDVLGVDVGSVREKVNVLLVRASELARAEVAGSKPNHRNGDLIGAKLRRADLRGANLRGAFLIAADLQNADLRRADVIGADFRDANLRGADLRDCLYLTQAQLDSAKGDATTRLPDGFRRPAHWNV